MLPVAASCFWQNEAQFQTYRTSQFLPSEANVVIIGSGITGVGVAYWLLQNHFEGSVILVDAKGICAGATGKNGGILSPRYLYEETEAGSDEYNTFNNFEFNTAKLIATVVEKEKIDCELHFNGGLRCVCGSNEENYVLRSSRLQDPELWSKEKLAEIFHTNDFDFGVFRKSPAQIHAAKFVWGLTKVLVESSMILNIQTQTKVTSVNVISKSDGYTVKTERGDISTTYVVYATNGYTSSILPETFNCRVLPKKAQVISTKPTIDLPKYNIVWNDGNEYYINREKDQKVIFGGFEDTLPRDRQNFDESLDADISDRIRCFLQDIPIFRNLEIDQEWVGIQGFTSDEQPFIGPLRTNEFIAAGYSGHGMPRAFGAAKMIADAICKKSVRWINIFHPDRFQYI